jgi:hypothetical protein
VAVVILDMYRFSLAQVDLVFLGRMVLVEEAGDIMMRVIQDKQA